MARRALFVCVGSCLALACTPTNPKPKTSAQTEATPLDTSRLVVGSVHLTEGPCARVRESWICADPDDETAARPRLRAREGERAAFICELSDAHVLTCEAPFWDRTFTDVDAFAVTPAELCIVRAGVLECVLLDDAGEGELARESEFDDVVDVAIGWQRCVRRGEADRPGPLWCDGERVADLALDVAMGKRHTCARTTEGVLCWSDRRDLGLGLGPEPESTRGLVAGITDVDGEPATIAALASGDHNTCALTEAGAVWCWGDDSRGQLGQGIATGASTKPVRVWGLEPAIGLRNFGAYTCALTHDLEFRCWGDVLGEWPAFKDRNFVRAVATPSRLDRPTPSRFAAPTGCIDIDLDSWRAKLEAAQDRIEVVALLAQLGLRPLGGDEPDLPIATEVVSVSIATGDLDGQQELDSLIVVRLVNERLLTSVGVAVLGAGPNRHCPIPYRFEAMTTPGRVSTWPGHTDFPLPQTLRFVKLLEPGRAVIENIRGDEGEDEYRGGLFVARYDVQLLAFVAGERGRLERIASAELYSVVGDEVEQATLEVVGDEWPRTLELVRDGVRERLVYDGDAYAHVLPPDARP